MPDGRISAELRRQISMRAGGCCEYCRSQARYATQAFSVEHIVPRAQGGATSLENLALACQGCNNHKHNKVEAPDPVSSQPVPLYHPRRDHWDTHFAWSDDFTLITVTLVDVLRRDFKQTYPRCVDGARACPPEDCGGVYGFAEIVSGDRDDPARRLAYSWYGDPDAGDSPHG